VLGIITMAPITLQAIHKTYRILSAWGVIGAIRDFFRHEDSAAIVKRRKPSTVQKSVQPPTRRNAPSAPHSTPTPQAPQRGEQRPVRPSPVTDPQPASKPQPFLKWHITNATGASLYFRFWTIDRRYRWPYARNHYRARPGRPTLITTRCLSTRQSVCYGAIGSVKRARPGRRIRSAWGRGPHADHHCRSCCYRCNGATIHKRFAP
jgi:hypothetical protein